MRNHTKFNTKLTDEKISAYKAAARPISIDDQLRNLDTYSLHHNTLHDLGVLTLALAAQRAWLEDALVLAATPATSAEEGLRKANYFEACLEAWVIPTAISKGHDNTCGILSIAAQQERDRWNSGPTGQAN